MRYTIYTFILLLLCQFSFAQPTQRSSETPFNDFFEEAYQTYPSVPRGILEAIAWNNTRIRHIATTVDVPSCTGMPARFGVMGLVADGQGWFNNNLPMISLLSGTSAQEIIANPRKEILAFAAAFDYLMQQTSLDPTDPAAAVPIIEVLSELPDDNTAPSNFALNSHVYSVLNFLNQSENQAKYHFPAYQIDLEAVFGAENLRVLSASRVTIDGDLVQAGEARYQPLPSLAASVDYPPALWNAAASCNYSSRSGTPISAVTIHTIQGSYAGAISWFQNCAASVSAHYCVRSSDGQVTQMVLESDKAWHVGTENPYTIGIEHEGYVADAAWYTNAMYASTVDLVQDIAASGYGIDLKKTWYGPPTAGLQVLGTNCYKIKGHQHYPNQSHVDPGINWDWDRFYRMLNGTPSTTTLTTCSGSFTDPGGNGNYADQERAAWLISPANAQSVTLTFSSFDTEAGYDYLYIYAGTDASGDFLGRYDGNTLPGSFTAQNGSLFLEFRSDCATNRPGWVANWTCSNVAPACAPADGLNVTALNPFGATLNWNAASGATSYEVRLRHSLETTWSTYPASATSKVLTGLKASSLYYWQVRTLCGASATEWQGGDFLTPAAANHTAVTCTGTFRDSGGDLAGYRNLESYTYVIDPPGAGAVTLSFNSFDTESNYDFLYLYDGNSTAAPLIGTYSGTNSPGTVTSSGGALTARFVSDSWTTEDGWEANWSCASNLAPTTAISPLNEWYSDDFTANFTDTDNSNTGIDLRYYQVLEFDTAWGCNRDNGFAFETFDAGFPNWTLASGNYYILNNALHQTDTVLTNSNIYLDVAQSAAQGPWLYTFSARLWPGASVNRRFGMHIFADDPTASQRGNSYLIWFRGDNQTVEIYETVNNALNLRVSQPLFLGDYVWNEYKIAYQPNSGRIEVYQEQSLVATWTDSSPLTSGGYVSLRTNQAHMDYENVRVWKTRTASTNILIGPQSTNDCRFESPDSATWAGQVHAISRDGAHNWSNVDLKSFKIDWTPPSDPAVADGTGQDIDSTFQNSSLSGNWTACTDANSGILRYEYALGTAPGSSDVRGWTDNGLGTSVTVSSLNLVHNQLYYISVRAVNRAELPSNEISSDGVLVWSPVTGTASQPAIEFLVYPVPTRDALYFQSDVANPVNVRLMDAYGRVLGSWNGLGAGEHRLDLSGVAQGAYWVEVMGKDGRRVVLRAVVLR